MSEPIEVKVTDGGAGFATNEDLSVKKVDAAGACETASVKVGGMK